MVEAGRIRTKRIYDPPDDGDGFRVLVDRLWPRGVSKETARVDLWAKELAPTTTLRKWFGHDPARFDEFRRRYRDELRQNAEPARQLLKAAGRKPVTLLFAARDRDCNQAVVLREFLREL